MSDNETTTEMLAEIEGQVDGITFDEVAAQQLVRGLVLQVAAAIEQQEKTEQQQPEKVITPDDVAGEALDGVRDQGQAEQQIAELRSEVHHVQKLYGEAQKQVVEQQHRIQELLTLNDTQQAEAAAVNEKRLQQVEELRNEVHHVQRLLGESRQRNKELEALVSSLRTLNEATEKAVISAGRENTDLQHRLDVVADQWADQAATSNGLQQQLEAVKAELVQQAETSRRLQIELDAAQQVPQAVSDRFEEGWDAGTARAVETIAEWLEPFRGCNSPALALLLLEALPAIMRTLTGLTPED